MKAYTLDGLCLICRRARRVRAWNLARPVPLGLCNDCTADPVRPFWKLTTSGYVHTRLSCLTRSQARQQMVRVLLTHSEFKEMKACRKCGTWPWEGDL
jgi:hypothetical protein